MDDSQDNAADGGPQQPEKPAPSFWSMIAEGVGNQWQKYADIHDRGEAIIRMAELEESVRTSVLSVFHAKGTNAEKLLGSQDTGGNLGFLDQCRLAYCLGLLGGNTLADLKLLAEIRNRFAHGGEHLTFDDPKIKQKCESLRIPDKILAASKSDAGREEVKAVYKFAPLWFLVVDQVGPYTTPDSRFSLSLRAIGAGLAYEVKQKMPAPLAGPTWLT